MKLLILLTLVSASFACVAKVKMDIYYTSLCADSMRFITDQLMPLYDDFQKHLDITFVPFGKARSSQETPESPVEFVCQFGENDCLGNKVQGCMLNQISDQDTKVAYVGCQMRLDSDRTYQTCVEEFGFSWNEILQCAQSESATSQQLDYEQISVPVMEVYNWVPTVAYNGKVTELSHTGRAPPLKEILCDLIYNTNPACKTKRRL